MAVPAGIHQLGDLEHIALEVWIDDDDCIRRIRHTSGDPKTGESTCTLDLIEFGIAPPSDWSRIPALLTPTLAGWRAVSGATPSSTADGSAPRRH